MHKHACTVMQALARAHARPLQPQLQAPSAPHGAAAAAATRGAASAMLMTPGPAAAAGTVGPAALGAPAWWAEAVPRTAAATVSARCLRANPWVGS